MAVGDVRVEVSREGAGAGAREERVRRGVWVRARGTRRVRVGARRVVMYDREPLAVACALSVIFEPC